MGGSQHQGLTSSNGCDSNLAGVKSEDQKSERGEKDWTSVFLPPPQKSNNATFHIKKWQSCRFQVSSKTILLPKLFWAKGGSANLRFVALQLSNLTSSLFWGVRTGGPWAPVPVEASGNLPRRRWVDVGGWMTWGPAGLRGWTDGSLWDSEFLA